MLVYDSGFMTGSPFAKYTIQICESKISQEAEVNTISTNISTYNKKIVAGNIIKCSLFWTKHYNKRRNKLTNPREEK